MYAPNHLWPRPTCGPITTQQPRDSYPPIRTNQVSELTSANAQLALQHAQAELAALAAAAARRTKTSSGGGCGRSRSQDGRGMPRAGQEDRWRLGGSAGLWLSRGTGAGSGYRSAPGGWGEDPLSGAEGGGSGSGAESEGGSRERPLPLPSVRAVPVGTAVQAAGFDGGGIGCDGVAAGRGAGASLRRWERCRGELGVLRRALKEAGEREAALRGALAAAQRGERAARLAVRAAAGEPGRVGRLEQQVGGKCGQGHVRSLGYWVASWDMQMGFPPLFLLPGTVRQLVCHCKLVLGPIGMLQ